MTNFSSSNQMQQAAEEVGYNFEQFGDDNGFCADSQGRLYPYIQYGSVISAEECGKMCSKCPGNDQGGGLVLRGFNYNPGKGNACVCLMDFQGQGIMCEGATGANFVNGGSGEIVNTSPAPSNQCWKVSSPSSSKGSKSPKSSKRPVRKLGQKNDSLSNVERKTDSQTISQ
mmetsp:Transcript_34811/g.52153  ORF Transcript_34811/g.52153 Transcript_34811/m.52153 type:complete len:171 (+) Transcript_34811:286-798(+)